MISIITYGRNDNYSYNLVKRTAFSFNCLAEVLTEEDEILFVDYNTPDHLPTLPESIWDTLTEKALARVKVIRISSEIHERVKGDSPLPILENVSRNAAIVRSNPANHWMLSTNPDVLLVLCSRWPNLAELLRTLPDSFYELPRFDIPESVWSSLHRGDPKTNISVLRDWLVAKKAAVAETIPDWRFQRYFLFDAPGDFQLAPRDYFFRLRGFDESMNRYLHSDSNLAKRMWLLNGKRTDHLLEHAWVLHQDHYLTGEWARNVGEIVHNDYFAKVLRQTEVEANGECWGLQGVTLPMSCLSDKVRKQRVYFSQIPTAVDGNLPLSSEVDWQTQPAYHLFHYNRDVLMLYLRENLQVMGPESQVAYLGESPATVESIGRLWTEISPVGNPIRDLASVGKEEESVAADVLLVDFYYDRPDYWARRVQLVQEQMQRQVEKGRTTEQEAAEEVSRFADNVDIEELERQLVPLWEKRLPTVQLCPGAVVMLLGCNQYVRPYARFQGAFAKYCLGLKMRETNLQRLHASYQQLKVSANSEGRQGILLSGLMGMRRLKRRSFGRLIGHESLMGFIYERHATRERKHFLERVNLQTQYVHHRLVVLRVR